MLKELEDLEVIEKAIAASSYTGEKKACITFVAQSLWGARNFATAFSSLGPFQWWTAEDIARSVLTSTS